MQSNIGAASYLLRLREVRRDGEAAWFASLYTVGSADQRQFPNIEALVTYLLAEFGSHANPADASWHCRPATEG